jgi:uncharacterized membrane protein
MQFIKTTIIGGLVFMVPIVIVIVILSKAYEMMVMVAKPLDNLIPSELIGGVALVNLIAVLAIAFICFIAGLVAKSRWAKKSYQTLDTALLALPGYAFIKGFTDSIKATEEEVKSLHPVLVQFDDNAQLGFEVERTEEGCVVVYIPRAPTPWSGSIAYFQEERVRRLDMTMMQAMDSIQLLGRGTVQHVK